jgi:hypothetical protein
MTTRTPNQAIAAARATTTFDVGMCLAFVRTAYGVGPHFASATAAWQGAESRHRVDTGMLVPRGAPVFWTGGSQGFGHVAIGTGNGNCWSSDAGGSGRTAKVRIDELTDRWGLTLQGWTEDLNGVQVYDAGGGGKDKKKAGGAERPRVQIKQLRPDPRDDVRAVQKALRKELPGRAEDIPVDGCFGKSTQDAYAAWQRRCGFTGDDADGIPGRISLQRLGFAVG